MNTSDISILSSGEFVGIRFFPTSSTSPPFHIALLIDNSGSMNLLNRLPTVKQTLSLLVNHLRENDRLTLVSYNHKASVLCRNETNKETILSCIANLQAGGGTNMESAFIALRGESYDAVFVLTDGEVNQGISSVVGLRQLASLCFPRIPVHTLGYGEDHNAELLRSIATSSRASYTYAEADERIPEVVGAIVGGLQGEAAKDVEVLWEEGRCLETGAEETKYWVGTLTSHKEQWVVFEGQPTGLRIRWRDGEFISPLSSECKSVLPHVFRAQSVALFDKIRQVPRSAQDELDVLEAAIVQSGLRDPLILRILAEIAEMREYIHQPEPTHLMRLTSNMQQFSVQRGADFASPTQRMVSSQMVNQFATFSQDPT
jgi:hypothetical protein